MEQMLEDYTEETFYPDYVNEINRSFDLLDKFNYTDIYSPFVAILMEYDISPPESVKDRYLSQLFKMLDEVLLAHKLSLDYNVSLYIRNEFLDALYSFQYLNDYSSIQSILETEKDTKEKFSEIISYLSSLSETQCLDSINEFDDDLINNIREYVLQKNESTETTHEEYIKENQPILDNIILFKKYLKDKNATGFDFIKSGVMVGLPFKSYLNTFKNHFDENVNEDNAINLVSLLLISKDGFHDTLTTYNTYVSEFVHDTLSITKMSSFTLKIIDQFQTYKRSIAKK